MTLLNGGASLAIPAVPKIPKVIPGPSPVVTPGTDPNDRGGALGINPPANQQPTLLTSPINSTAISGPQMGTGQVPGTLAVPGGNPQASPLGTSVTPASPPDYTWSILNDPLYMALQGNLAAQQDSLEAQQKQSVDQALAQWGQIPNFGTAANELGLDPSSPLAQMISGDVDQQTTDAANNLTQAGLSTTAQLAKQHSTDIQSLLDSMAARGTVQSGGTGVGLGQADQAYSQNQYNGLQSLLSYLTGAQTTYNTGLQGLQQQLAQGAQDATTRQIGLAPAGSNIVQGIVPSLNIGATS